MDQNDNIDDLIPKLHQELRDVNRLRLKYWKSLWDLRNKTLWGMDRENLSNESRCALKEILNAINYIRKVTPRSEKFYRERFNHDNQQAHVENYPMGFDPMTLFAPEEHATDEPDLEFDKAWDENEDDEKLRDLEQRNMQFNPFLSGIACINCGLPIPNEREIYCSDICAARYRKREHKRKSPHNRPNPQPGRGDPPRTSCYQYQSCREKMSNYDFNCDSCPRGE